MTVRLGCLSLLLAIIPALAGDGIDTRPSANDYPAHLTAGKVAIGAAYVPPAQVKKLFGDDLDKHGYVVFEIGVFPLDGAQIDVSADDFKLRQGKDTSFARAATPHSVSSAVHPQVPSDQPKVPGNVNVTTTDTIGYERGPYGRSGVYTASDVGVGVGRRPGAPPPPPPASSGNDQVSLQQQIEEKALPETKTAKPVAGYVMFPKSAVDKHTEFELTYFGLDGPVSMKLSGNAKP